MEVEAVRGIAKMVVVVVDVHICKITEYGRMIDQAL